MSENKINENSYIFIRKSTIKDECLLEFDFNLGELNQSYCFQRKLSNSIEEFFNKVKHKISQIKYRKSGKKLKNIDESKLTNCVLKLLSKEGDEIDPSEITISEAIKADNNQMQVSISGDIYHFWEDPVWVKSVILPVTLLVQCPIVPQFVMSHGFPESLTLNWFTKQSPNDWQKVSDEPYFTPNQLHVDNQLKLEIYSPTKSSKQNFILESNTNIGDFKLPDYMLELEMANLSISLDSERTFRLMTYNLLANCYAESKKAENDLYRHCKKQFLQGRYRYPLILREILQINADVILLQEVDIKFFKQYLSPVLTHQGFLGIHQIKSSAANEGGAIFWRKSNFNLLENISRPSISQLVTNDSNEDKNSSSTQTKIAQYFKQNPNIKSRWDGLGHSICACILKHKSTNQNLVFSTNHLFYHPIYEQFRVFQAALTLDHCATAAAKYSPQASVVFAGDFNASYEDQSIKYVLDKSIKLLYENSNKSLTFCHHLPNFTSAFEGNLKFSNYTPDYTGLLDHIFFDNEVLNVESLCKVPSEENIKLHRFLPNQYHPSDHIPLSVDLSFKYNKVVNED